MGHARLSASQTKRWAACPGSVAVLEGRPDLEGSSNQYAQMGTCAHALVERCLGEGSYTSDYEGRLIEILDPGGDEGTSFLRKNAKMPTDPQRVVFEVDDDMVEATGSMVRYVRRRCWDLGLLRDIDPEDTGLAKAVAKIVGKTLHLEKHVTPLPDRDDTGGTADTIIDAWPEMLEVVDYKNGSGVFVPVEGNEQLRSYGLGALREVGSDDYETVRYTICQPRHMQSPSDGIMSEDTGPKELLEWGDWLTERASQVDLARSLVDEGADFARLYKEGLVSTGEDGSHCNFCELLSECPAALDKAQELAVTDFDDEPAEPEVPQGDNSLAMLLPWVPFLDKWLKEVSASAERLLLAGGSLSGFKLVRKRSNRQWVDKTEDELIGELKGYGLKKGDCLTEPKLLSGPQIEKLIDKDQREEFNKDLLVKPEGGLTVASEDDKRAAVMADPAADFDDVED